MIKMVNIDLIAFIVLVVVTTFFLYKNKNKVEIQKIIFPLLYMVLYKTKKGLSFMDKFAKKRPKFLNVMQYVSIFIGLAGMIFISVFMIINTVKLFTTPSVGQGVSLVLPIQVEGVFYVPFFYWLISIFIIATIHESTHGIFARFHKIKLKSTGFAFFSILLPIIPAAFVEPDEKQLAKSKTKSKLAVLSGGPFSNILTAFIFLGLFLLLSFSVNNVYYEDGVKIINTLSDTPASFANVTPSNLYEIEYENNVYNVTNSTYFFNLASNFSANETVRLITDKGNYSLNLIAHPENSSKGFMGINTQANIIIKEEFSSYSWFFDAIMWLIGLFYWLYLLSLGVGLFNLLPLGIVDGGQILRYTLEHFFGKTKDSKKKVGKVWGIISIFFLLLIFIQLLYPVFF